MLSKKDKFSTQDSLYKFPYHYIPNFDANGVVSLCRKLNWGLEYLCYQKHLNEKVAAMKPASVLEVGCGDGSFIGGLPESIGIKVGVDLSERAIAFAKAFHPNCDFHVLDVAVMGQTFDVVAAIEVIEHIPDEFLPRFLKSMAERVSANGVVVISVPTTVIPLTKKHYRHYTLELLKNQLEASGCGLHLDSHEYIYAKPWWFGAFSRLFDNRLISIELKPFMQFAWKTIWRKYRYADKETGYHLVALLRKS